MYGAIAMSLGESPSLIGAFAGVPGAGDLYPAGCNVSIPQLAIRIHIGIQVKRTWADCGSPFLRWPFAVVLLTTVLPLPMVESLVQPFSVALRLYQTGCG